MGKRSTVHFHVTAGTLDGRYVFTDARYENAADASAALETAREYVAAECPERAGWVRTDYRDFTIWGHALPEYRSRVAECRECDDLECRTGGID